VQPVRDLQERIVGALYIAFDLADFDSAIEHRVDTTRFFESGSAYVVDPGRNGEPATMLMSRPAPWSSIGPSRNPRSSARFA